MHTHVWSRWFYSGEFNQTFKEEIIRVLCKIFQNIEEETIPSNSFFEIGI